MSHETSHGVQFAQWLTKNWQFTALLAGGMFWSAVWSVKKVFPTHKVMMECETRMRIDMKDHERMVSGWLHDFRQEESEEHQAINSRLDRIIDHLIKGNGT